MLSCATVVLAKLNKMAIEAIVFIAASSAAGLEWICQQS
jgi:hypothetical protein